MKLSNAKVGASVVFKDKYVLGEKKPFFKWFGKREYITMPHNPEAIFTIISIFSDGDFGVKSKDINNHNYCQSVNHKCFKKYKG